MTFFDKKITRKNFLTKILGLTFFHAPVTTKFSKPAIQRFSKQSTENSLLNDSSQNSYAFNVDNKSINSSNCSPRPINSQDKPILSDRAFLSSEMIKNRLVAAAFVAYSYSGAEISYPSKPFLRLIPDNQNKVYSKTPHGHVYYRKMFWGHVMELVEELSEELQAIHLEGLEVKKLKMILKNYSKMEDIIHILSYTVNISTTSSSNSKLTTSKPAPKNSSVN